MLHLVYSDCHPVDFFCNETQSETLKKGPLLLEYVSVAIVSTLFSVLVREVRRSAESVSEITNSLALFHRPPFPTFSKYKN